MKIKLTSKNKGQQRAPSGFRMAEAANDAADEPEPIRSHLTRNAGVTRFPMIGVGDSNPYYELGYN